MKHNNDNDFKNRIKYENPDQQDIHEKMMLLLDKYQQSNSFENREFLCYLTSAIFLTYKKLYPQLVLYIPFRTKSDKSYMNNIPKEFKKYISNVESKKSFDVFPVIKDISGLRIVFDNINFSIPPQGKSHELFADSEISTLLKDANDNLDFISQVEDYLHSSIKIGKKCFELKKELLDRIVKITPPEFTKERAPKSSFFELKQYTQSQYDYFLEMDSFPTTVEDTEISELSNLLDDLRSRVYDPLHFAISRKTLPVVFEDPLIKNALKTSFEWSKEIFKENGFHACYGILNTPFGPIELQSQSNKAFYASTKGSAYHSGLDGKTINVKEFFELVDENDEHDVSYYIDILDSISADKMVSSYEIPEFKTEIEKEEFYNTPKGKDFLESEKYREMMKHIKIKDKMHILPEHLPKEAYKSDSSFEIDNNNLQKLIDNGTIHPMIVDTNEYLFSTALSLSPYMNVCSSGHTSYTTASIHHKKVIGEFSEILRKKDSNTLLRDMLIRRLEDLIENYEYLDSDSIEKLSPSLKESIKIVRRHEEMASKLPKDISQKNIFSYAEKKLKNIEKTQTNEKEFNDEFSK